MKEMGEMQGPQSFSQFRTIVRESVLAHCGRAIASSRPPWLRGPKPDAAVKPHVADITSAHNELRSLRERHSRQYIESSERLAGEVARLRQRKREARKSLRHAQRTLEKEHWIDVLTECPHQIPDSIFFLNFDDSGPAGNLFSPSPG